MSAMKDKSPLAGRILSLDQYRGYTILGMIFVNFLGRFDKIPEFFKHHSEYITYADTIAPIFLFVAGVGFRLSFLRNQAKLGLRRALWLGLRRYVILTLVGIVYYDPLNWHGWWDALVDIGLSGILALPFVGLGTAWRVGAACFYVALYQVLFMATPYGPWDMSSSYDGGPLGPLSWSFSLLFGTIIYDLVANGDPKGIVRGCLAWGIGLFAAGWALHLGLRALWPNEPSFWRFSQHAMTAPYPVLATGIAFLCFLPFYLLCDRGGIELPTLTVMGANPLVLYMLSGMYTDIHGGIIPFSSSAPAALAAFAACYIGCWIVARYLYNNRMIVKI